MLPRLFQPYVHYTFPGTLDSRTEEEKIETRLNILPGLLSTKKSWFLDSLEPKHPLNMGNLLAINPAGSIFAAINTRAVLIQGSHVVPVSVGNQTIVEVSATVGSQFVLRSIDGSILLAQNERSIVLDKAKRSDFFMASSVTEPWYAVSEKSRLRVIDIESKSDLASYVGLFQGTMDFASPHSLYLGQTGEVYMYDLSAGSRQVLKLHPAAIATGEKYLAVAADSENLNQVAAVSQSVVHVFDIRRNSRSPLSECPRPDLAGPGVFSRPILKFRADSLLLSGGGLYAYTASVGSAFRSVSISPAWDSQIAASEKNRECLASEIFEKRSRSKYFSPGFVGLKGCSDLVEFSLGIDWNSSKKEICSLTSQGNLLTNNNKTETRSTALKSVYSPGRSLDSKKFVTLDKFNFSQVSHETPLNDAVIIFFILAQAGLRPSVLPRCLRHLGIRKAKVGSFMWNSCVKKCHIGKQRTYPAKRDEIFCLNVSSLQIEILHTYGRHFTESSIVEILLRFDQVEQVGPCSFVVRIKATVDSKISIFSATKEPDSPENSERRFVNSLFGKAANVVTPAMIENLKQHWPI